MKATAKAAPKKAAPKKKAAAVKLTDKQLELLKKVKDARKPATPASKGDTKGLESLQTKKLHQAWCEEQGERKLPLLGFKTGEKHLSTPPARPEGLSPRRRPLRRPACGAAISQPPLDGASCSPAATGQPAQRGLWRPWRG